MQGTRSADRHPSYEGNEVLLSSLNTWSRSGRCLILGDFNAPMVDWVNPQTELSDYTFEHELGDAVITCVLVQHVKEATRYDPDTESSLLDLILAHLDDDVTNLDYTLPLSKSDHAVLNFDFHITVNHEHTLVQSRPNVWEANIQYIIHSASSVDWTIEPESLIETDCSDFLNLYLKPTAPHIALTTPREPKNSPPWFRREEKNTGSTQVNGD
ncbi:unnamed protein product [Schistosoma margrebowiei]|uniref:Uncharacterized protein n=1 Tax=Schistosoma margrebowiei TaxID=48269 RepID=A0A183MQ24_9TREM|nr:unnamed protein product [Schistosoma margrebowiei]